MVMQKVSDKLLSLLDPDTLVAQKTLTNIRKKLRAYFSNRASLDSVDLEDLASETIARVVKKITDGIEITSDGFLYGVARYVLKEYLRVQSQRRERSTDLEELGQASVSSENAGDLWSDEEEQKQNIKCLRKCMQCLKPEDRELIKQYSDASKHYTEQLGAIDKIKANKMRVQIYRIIREKLKPCVEKCLEQ